MFIAAVTFNVLCGGFPHVSKVRRSETRRSRLCFNRQTQSIIRPKLGDSQMSIIVNPAHGLQLRIPLAK
jgi:hypothetical protein